MGDGDGRAIRDEESRSAPPSVPADLAESLTAPLDELALEFLQYCVDACDIAHLCVRTTGAARSQCVTDCGWDLRFLLGATPRDEEGIGCFESVVDSFFCETSFTGGMDSVCSAFIDDARADECAGDYSDTFLLCAAYSSVTSWFFNQDRIANLDGSPGNGGWVPEDDPEIRAEIEDVLEATRLQCIIECETYYYACYPDDSVYITDCQAGCSALAEQAGAALEGNEDALECANAVEAYWTCRARLDCDDYYLGGRTGGDACAPELEVKRLACARWEL